MLSDMEKARNAITTDLDTLEKSLNPTSGVVLKSCNAAMIISRIYLVEQKSRRMG